MLFTEILLALQRGISRLPNLQAFHHIGGPRRGPGGERKAPWSPPQRRNPLRYGARKEGLFPAFRKKPSFYEKPYPPQEEGAEGFQRASGKPFGRLRRGETLCETGKSKEGLSPAFHKKSVPCGRFRPPAGGRGTFHHWKVPKGCRGRPKGACLMAAPGPPVAKLQCTASLAGARPAGFTSVPGRAAVAFGAVDPSPGGWAPVYPWSHGKVPPRSGCLGATLPWTVRHAQKIWLQVLLPATIFFACSIPQRRFARVPGAPLLFGRAREGLFSEKPPLANLAVFVKQRGARTWRW